MNYNKVFKRETKVIAYVVICLTLVVIGVSYALFLQVNNNTNNQVVTAGNLEITYSQGNTIIVDESTENNCLLPQSDDEGSGSSGCQFKLSITNTGTLPMQYNLLIYDNVDDAPIGATFVDHSLIRFSLNKQYSDAMTSETVVSAASLSSLETYNDTLKRILESSVINVGETITFALNIWISEDAPTDIIGQYVYLKLDVNGTVSEEEKVLLSDYIIDASKTDATIVKLTQESTEQTGENATTEYRYSGDVVNNWVYFGCSDACTEDNLYRIIGVFPTQETAGGEYKNRVKLIKANYYTESTSGYLETHANAPGGQGYRWNKSSGSNVWASSTLKNYVLNGVYWDSLGEYQKFIAPAVWYLGAPTNSSYTTYTPNQLYTVERSSTKAYSGGETSIITNIGLMYPSDYGYSIEKSYWDQAIYSNAETYVYNAWLYNLTSSTFEWTMTPESSYYNSTYGASAWYLDPAGGVSYSTVYDTRHVFGVRPVFYLDSEVLYIEGEGTSETPYRISLD